MSGAECGIKRVISIRKNRREMLIGCTLEDRARNERGVYEEVHHWLTGEGFQRVAFMSEPSYMGDGHWIIDVRASRQP